MMLALALSVIVAGGWDGEDVSIRLTVSNFYKTADGTTWSSGSWELTCRKGSEGATVRVVLEPQAKDGKRRDQKGEMSLKEFRETLADLKAKGLFTTADSRPCLCDAPSFTMTATEGKKSNTFVLDHAHTDHDWDQKGLVDAFIKLADARVAESRAK